MIKTRLNFWIDKPVAELFKGLCNKEGVSMSEMMRRLIEVYVKEINDKKIVWIGGDIYQKIDKTLTLGGQNDDKGV